MYNTIELAEVMKKDKILALVVMAFSLLMLGTIAIQGKIIGRDYARHEEYIKERFYYQSAQNYSEAQLTLNNIPPEEMGRISQQGMTLAKVVVVNFISILGAIIIISKISRKKIFAE
jgi:hypothetical protein